ncbi:MAG: MFS transporter, partial [bacterium]
NKKNTIGYRTNSDIKKEDSKKIGNRNIILLFKNRDYIFVLFISFLIFIPNIMIFTYLAPIIKSVGGNSTNLGYTLFFNALSEAPVFFISKYFLIKYKTKFLLLFSASFYLIRIIIAAVAVSPVYFIFYGLLQSLSFGVYLVTVRYYIKMVAPEGLKTTAQSFAQMASFGGGGIVASLLGGYLIDNYGMNAMFITCIFFISLAVVILLVSIMRNKT